MGSRKTRGGRGTAPDPVPMAEVVCPACSRLFKAPEEAAQGTCPFCRKALKFGKVQEFEEAAPASRHANGRRAEVTCPVCESTVAAPPGAQRFACAACGAPLALRAAPPEAVGEVTCPRCARRFEVGLEAREAPCPHCGAELEFEDEAPRHRVRLTER